MTDTTPVMTAIKRISKDVVIYTHQLLSKKYDTPMGIRSEALLDSALSKPQMVYYYCDHTDNIVDIGVSYAMGFIKNHPFIDGNKRIGLACMLLFFRLSGYRLSMDHRDLVDMIVGVAASDIDENALKDIITRHLVKI